MKTTHKCYAHATISPIEWDCEWAFTGNEREREDGLEKIANEEFKGVMGEVSGTTRSLPKFMKRNQISFV